MYPALHCMPVSYAGTISSKEIIMTQTLYELGVTIRDRLNSAQKRVKGTEDEQKARYYKGQVDALHVVLRDIEAAKFELGMELDDVALRKASRRSRSSADASGEGGTSQSKATRKPRRRRSRVEPPQSPYKSMADEAVAKEVIVRSSSHFMHPLLPKGHAQGFNQLYQAFDEDENLRKGIQEELDKLSPHEDSDSLDTQEASDDTQDASAPAEEETE